MDFQVNARVTEKIQKQKFTLARGGCPLRRVGTPEDIAHASAYLASKDVAFVTGTMLAVDGGMLVLQNIFKMESLFAIYY